MLQLIHFLYEVYCFIFQPVLFGVRVMLVKDDQALLVKHTYKKGWYFPGGGIKRGETVEEAARREVREETGAELRTIRLVGVFTSFFGQAGGHEILFISDDFNIVGKPDHEIAESRFFPLDDLPADLWQGHRRRLEEYRDTGQVASFGEW
jgi:8-oxo-dGTP pyrophosphatase MutT (NUDIX family)